MQKLVQETECCVNEESVQKKGGWPSGRRVSRRVYGRQKCTPNIVSDGGAGRGEEGKGWVVVGGVGVVLPRWNTGSVGLNVAGKHSESRIV